LNREKGSEAVSQPFLPKLDPKPGGAFGRRAVTLPAERRVAAAPLDPARRLPLVLRPAVEGLDVAAWAEEHRHLCDAWMREHRALLWRGFDIASPADFQRLVRATSDGEPLEYRDRSTPRHEVSQGIYVSTIYPAAQSINMHNEGTYWRRFPRKLYFCSLVTAESGGETPIADVRGVLARLDPEVRESFRAKGVLYVRNYNDGLGLSWQEVFQTESRAEVEDYCRANGIEVEWKDGQRLRTRQRRPAIRRHPVSGEELWFNHGAFFNVSSLEPAVRDALLADFGAEGLPYNTYFGDGSPIAPEVVASIQAAYAAEKVVFPWQRGDVLVLDNLTVAHGRQPYTGQRQVIVAMTEPLDGGDRGGAGGDA
jgi:alpha-ketoglutarate-dependent taurine dioxygenase